MTVPAPETVTDAVAFLAERGYVEDFTVCPTGIAHVGHDEPHPVEGATVDHTFRFEGMSDPGDEAIVLGVTCGAWGDKGVIVAAYGPDTDPEEAAILTALARSARRLTRPRGPAPDRRRPGRLGQNADGAEAARRSAPGGCRDHDRHAVREPARSAVVRRPLRGLPLAA